MSTDTLTSTFIRFRAKLRSVAAGIVGTDTADDVIHDAFCRLWSGNRMVESETEAMKLSYVAVRNLAIDTLRKANARPTVPIDESPQLSQASDEDDERQREQRHTYEAVINISRRALNEKQFEIFRLHDIEGIGYDEIAAQLGMTPENVRVTLSRSRKIIRDIYRSQNQ